MCLGINVLSIPNLEAWQVSYGWADVVDVAILLSDDRNYINPGYGLSLVDTLWNASSYRQPLEQEGNPMT